MLGSFKKTVLFTLVLSFGFTVGLVQTAIAQGDFEQREILARGRANLVGNWQMSGVRCVNAQGSSAPKYEMSINMRLSAQSYVADGAIAGYTCRITGTYMAKNESVLFKIADDGGCGIADYLNGKFSADVSGNKMLVSFGTKIGEALCEQPNSALQISLVKKSKL